MQWSGWSWRSSDSLHAYLSSPTYHNAASYIHLNLCRCSPEPWPQGVLQSPDFLADPVRVTGLQNPRTNLLTSRRRTSPHFCRWLAPTPRLACRSWGPRWWCWSWTTLRPSTSPSPTATTALFTSVFWPSSWSLSLSFWCPSSSWTCWWVCTDVWLGSNGTLSSVVVQSVW